MDYDEYDIGYIPPNFKEGVSILGYMVRIPYVLQAVPITAVIIGLILLLGGELSVVMKLVIGLVTCGPVLVLAMSGIGGTSIYGYIGMVLRSKRREKVFFYNPRVKTEIKPLDDDPGSVEMLPREKILLYMEKRRAGKERKAGYDRMEVGEMYFEDDIGLADKPYSYMTPKERRAYDREQRNKKR